jgi:D-glycero-alpha-D-manno-heptose-7-phosphate kinase
VLNSTIDKFAYATIKTRNDGFVELLAADNGVCWKGRASECLPLVKGLELHTGVYNRIVREFKPNDVLSVSITTHSDAPPGSGLGSSSAMVVALVQAFCEYDTLPLGAYDVAQLAYEIERIDLGLAGGRQDQYAATFGGLNFMEFYGDRVIVNPLQIKESHRVELESSLVLFYTGISRESAHIIDEQMQNVKSSNENSVQAMHDLKVEAVHMKEAIRKGDFDALAMAMRVSWEAKKKMAHRISNQQINEIYEAAMKEGARAGKVSGAGGGGFMMFVVDPVERARVIKSLREFPGFVSTCSFVEHGVHSWRVD